MLLHQHRTVAVLHLEAFPCGFSTAWHSTLRVAMFGGGFACPPALQHSLPCMGQPDTCILLLLLSLPWLRLCFCTPQGAAVLASALPQHCWHTGGLGVQVIAKFLALGVKAKLLGAAVHQPLQQEGTALPCALRGWGKR